MTKRVVLDFSELIEENLFRQVEQSAELIRKEYVEFLEKVIRHDEKNLDWWVMDFISRNTLASPLFKYCCFIRVIQGHLEKGDSIQVRVDSPALAKTLRRHFKSAGKEEAVDVVCSCSQLLNPKIFLGSAQFLFLCGRLMLQFLLARIIKSVCKNKTTENAITLIDTFVLGDSFKDGGFSDRYYGSLLKHVDENEKEYIFYLPTFHGITVREYKKLFQNIRKSRFKFLIKEDFLCISDYINAFLYPFRVLQMRPAETDFKGIDIGPLIFDEMKNSMFSSSAVLGLLNYRFFKRLNRKKVKVKRLINWFENQTIDHGLNRGFADFFPDAEHIGYQGFPMSKNYLGLYPTGQEQRCKVIPKIIAVMGKGYKKSVQVFADDLEVTVAPALRYDNVWPKVHFSPKLQLGVEAANKPAVLLALPYFLEESSRILNMMGSVFERIGNLEWKVYVKLHPTVSQEQMVRHYGRNLPPGFKLVTGDFGFWLDQSGLLVSGSSTTTLETVAKGKPVVIIAAPAGLTQLFIPDNVPGEIWRLCYGKDDLEKALVYFANIDVDTKSRFSAIGREVRQDYFEPVTREGARTLLGMDNPK